MGPNVVAPKPVGVCDRLLVVWDGPRVEAVPLGDGKPVGPCWNVAGAATFLGWVVSELSDVDAFGLWVGSLSIVLDVDEELRSVLLLIGGFVSFWLLSMVARLDGSLSGGAYWIGWGCW